VLGLAPHSTYDVEIDDEELSEATPTTEARCCSVAEGIDAGVRLKSVPEDAGRGYISADSPATSKSSLHREFQIAAHGMPSRCA